MFERVVMTSREQQQQQQQQQENEEEEEEEERGWCGRIIYTQSNGRDDDRR